MLTRELLRAPDATDEERLRSFLDTLSAYMEAYHGGSVEMVSYADGLLSVRLGGACLGCELTEVTLHGWIEGTLRPFFPNLKVVQVL